MKDRKAGHAAVHGVTNGQTQLSDQTELNMRLRGHPTLSFLLEIQMMPSGLENGEFSIDKNSSTSWERRPPISDSAGREKLRFWD